MSGFPNLSNIEPSIAKTIQSKANATLYNSGKLPWFRLVTLDGPPKHSGEGRGLVIDSLNSNESFSSRYGSVTTSGIVGYTNKYEPVRAGTISSNPDDNLSYETRGFRPSPTIENLKIENGTEGLTRKVSFTIKCYTLAQAEVVGRHYLDPGSYVLVEYGWNTQKSYAQRAGGSEITVCDLVQYSNLAVLKDKRKASEGTYDAVLALITGGGMTFGDDETFNIEVKLTSQGELPAYLRNQTGGLVSVEQAKSGVKFTQGELDSAEDEETGNVGKFLFMQMYNDLPLAKQIGDIKNLSEESSTDSNGIPWIHPANFLNMDTEIREDLFKSLKDVKLNSKEDEKLKIPDDVPLFSNDRFIRFELAYKILQTVDSGKKVDTGCKPYRMSGGNEINIKRIQDISIENTICRAHRHIFSTDKSRLFIPNTNMPDFQLTAFLSNSDVNSGSLDPFVSGNPATVNAHPNSNSNLDENQGKSDNNIFAFPSLQNAELPDWYDETIIKGTPQAYNYGYLKNLYINYDFFINVIKKPGLLMHEALMELLNGMSTAVNLFWDFQLVEVGDPSDGNSILKVVDKSFLGLTKEDYKKDTNGIPQVITTKFQSRGINSPFLDATMDISIAGDMMNQIMMQKEQPVSDNNGNTDNNIAGFTSTEGRAQNIKTGLFSYHLDPVSEKISFISNQAIENEEEVAKARATASLEAEKSTNDERSRWSATKDIASSVWSGIKKAGSGIAEGATTIWTGDSKEAREIRKNNFKYLSERAGVFPKVNDRNFDYDVANEWYDTFLTSGNDADIEEVLFIGTWDDPFILKKYELYDLMGCEGKPSEESTFDTNPVLVPIKFNFTIHGISGLKVGDCFIIKDLPRKYSDKIFQITQIEHEVSDLWKTTVEAQMRNV
jgi:hypothetical protein